MKTYSEKTIKKTSKLLSLLLRHKPEAAQLNMNENGWVAIDELIEKVSRYHFNISRPLLEEVVANNNKKRFSFNKTGTHIRAAQGHSIDVQIEMEALQPPEILFHGTAQRNVESIMAAGLKSMNRQHVHLSHETQTATSVGQRHGKPVILQVLAAAMYQDGYAFYRSENGVWLTDHVPPAYIRN